MGRINIGQGNTIDSMKDNVVIDNQSEGSGERVVFVEEDKDRNLKIIIKDKKDEWDTSKYRLVKE